MNYENLLREMRSLAEHVSYPITNLANASALLFEEMDRLNWAGFYIRQGEELLLGPFQGKVACTRIPLGKGVCGTAAKSGQTQLVKDVHEFPGHIACDSASNSEIVVPLWKDGEVWGVLDIDSPEKARFDEKDQEGLRPLPACWKSSCKKAARLTELNVYAIIGMIPDFNNQYRT